MGLRTSLATSAMSTARSFGRVLGCEIAVEVSNHSIETKMVLPGKSDRAWDDQLYRHGNLFVDGYANPIKPRADPHPELDKPDTVEVEDGDGNTLREKAHVIASERYQSFMKQRLAAQLLNPSERIKLITYAMMALAGLMLMQFIAVAAIAASVGVF